MYKTVAIGGTFDRLHKGHRYFIQKAFNYGKKVTIGLTSDSFVKAKFQISNFKFLNNFKIFNDRKLELENFLREEKIIDRAKIVMINDVYGSTLEQNDIDALVVTKDSRGGGEEVNRKRKELNLLPIKIIEVDLISADDKKSISSTRIRLGEIDRWGKVFSNLAVYGTKISEKLRLKLKKPLGQLVTGDISKNIEGIEGLIVTVGDAVTSYLNKLGKPFDYAQGKQADISIVDFYIKRIKTHETLEDLDFSKAFLKEKYKDKILKAKNPPGHITKELCFAVKNAYSETIADGKKRVIQVEGEEDLAGVPAILLAPLGSLVLYGQPGYQTVTGKQDQGIVVVKVTEDVKREISEMIDA